jgi:hypothetical protein
MRAWLGLVLIVVAVPGCPIGPSAGSFRPATDPAGITVRVGTGQRTTLVGELLVAGDTALLVLADQKVQLVPFRAIQAARFEQRSSLDFGNGSTPRDSQLRQIRQLARFPAGLSPDLLQKLLQASGQTEPGVVR